VWPLCWCLSSVLSAVYYLLFTVYFLCGTRNANSSGWPGDWLSERLSPIQTPIRKMEFSFRAFSSSWKVWCSGLSHSCFIYIRGRNNEVRRLAEFIDSTRRLTAVDCGSVCNEFLRNL